MRRVALLAVAAVALAGCGGGGSKSTSSAASTTVARPDPVAAMQELIAKSPALAGTIKVLFNTGDWAVVQSSRGDTAHAVVFRNANGKWVADRSEKVKVAILGPKPGGVAPRLAQVAIGVTSKLPFVDSGLWVDGTELFEKGGGSATRGTIYGAPGKPLAPGTHVAVGYARNIVSGTAVAWVFQTK